MSFHWSQHCARNMFWPNHAVTCRQLGATSFAKSLLFWCWQPRIFPKPLIHWSTITFISVHAKPPSQNLLHHPLPLVWFSSYPSLPLSVNLKLTLSPSFSFGWNSFHMHLVLLMCLQRERQTALHTPDSCPKLWHFWGICQNLTLKNIFFCEGREAGTSFADTDAKQLTIIERWIIRLMNKLVRCYFSG